MEVYFVYLQKLKIVTRETTRQMLGMFRSESAARSFIASESEGNSYSYVIDEVYTDIAFLPDV